MPKGKIVSIGGNLDLFPEDPILEKIIDEIKEDEDHSPTLSIIPSASKKPYGSAKQYSHLFSNAGAETQTIYPENREEANEESLLEKVRESDGFFFTGGSQLRITALLGGTQMVEEMHKKFEEGALVSGTSAGAVCLTRTMIAYGDSEESLLHGMVELSPGLNFIEDAVIDTHFTVRGRFPRLIHVVTEHPGVLGVGLGEDIAAVWDFEEMDFTVIGSSNIVVVDGKDIGQSNVPNIQYREPICVEGVQVHVLGNGWGYDLEEHKPFRIEDFDITHPNQEVLAKKDHQDPDDIPNQRR
ncbi:MAG: cyanophycinase [Candidatus Thermoplasmatota archaeon]|nr:cyanophycinase [Candidatus Thermoplasmatota archaeon]